MKTLREQIEEIVREIYERNFEGVAVDDKLMTRYTSQLLFLIDSTVQEAIGEDEVVQWGMQINWDAIVHNQAKQEIRDRWEKLKGKP